MSNAGYGNHDEPPPTKVAQNGEAGTPPPRPKAADAARTVESGISTPGDGAGPDAPVGKDVDPGVG